ncbi:hypothetical protein AT959_09760 [Dechloromonas denitrificans]|uniref:Uncharacterized protein n=1 Tax=Dechloromonas denitrificans TaxID=281362 RepID=A0A133XJ60_9RHOO|nr:hypothetical protein AT959_09760 [Dechloromonas denitrificans]
MRGGALRVDGGQLDVAEHHRRPGLAGQLPERLPVAGQFGRRLVEASGAQMGVLFDPAEAGEVLQRGADAAFAQAFDIAGGDRADRGRVGGDGAGR